MATEDAEQRFIAAWSGYAKSIIVQTERRGKSYICTIDEYLAARWDDSAVACCSALCCEIALQLDLPHEVMQHPYIRTLVSHAGNMVLLSNVSRSVNRHESKLKMYIAGHVLVQEGIFRARSSL